MTVFLNNVEIEKDLLQVNSGLNYGRFYDEQTEDYEVRLGIAKLIPLIEKEYNSIRDEIREDDKVFNDTSKFSTTNYCAFIDMLKFEKDFESIFKTYLDRAFYEKVFTKTQNTKFVINSTESVRIRENEVVIKGKVFEMKETQ